MWKLVISIIIQVLEWISDVILQDKDIKQTKRRLLRLEYTLRAINTQIVKEKNIEPIPDVKGMLKALEEAWFSAEGPEE